MNDLRVELIKWFVSYDTKVESHSPPSVSETLDSIIAVFKNANYVQIRKGDLYWTKEQLSAPDWAAKYYKE